VAAPLVAPHTMGLVSQTIPGVMMANTACVSFAAKPELSTGELMKRTLHIANLAQGVTSQELMEFFNGAVLAVTGNTIQNAAAKLAPVFDCKVDVGERKGTLVFRTPDGSNVGMKLNGIEYKQHKLKVERPEGFLAKGEPDPACNIKLASLTMNDLFGPPPTQVIEDKGKPKLSIFNLSQDLSESTVRDLLQQFGNLRMMNLIKDLATGQIKGYGFLEYENDDDTEVALKALNGFVCGVNVLRVTKLGGPQKIEPPKPAEEPVTGTGTLESLTSRITSNHVLAMQVRKGRELGSIPTRLVQLVNAVYQEDLMDGADYEEIKQEVREQAARMGAVSDVYIPRPSKVGEEVDGLGKIFVLFQDVTSARKFQADVNGRKFENRAVCAAFYPLDRYLAKKYTLFD